MSLRFQWLLPFILASTAIAQQNPIVLHDDVDTPQRLSDPGLLGFNTGGLTPVWGGDLAWKTFPKEVLRRACPDTMSVTAIELWIDDTNFITPATFANVYITEGITTALGIEPDPANVIYSSGPVFFFLTPGCTCQKFTIPLGTCSTLGLPALQADGTKDYCVVVAQVPIQSTVPPLGPCFAGDYASICSSSKDDMFAHSGPTSAFSGANKTAAWSPFLLPLNESLGIELEFCEPTIQATTLDPTTRTETSGVHLSFAADKQLGARVTAQQYPGWFVAVGATLVPPLASAIVIPPDLCVLLNPSDPVLSLTLKFGVLLGDGTYEYPFVTLTPPMVGLCAWMQGYLFDPIVQHWDSTQVWRTCVWP